MAHSTRLPFLAALALASFAIIEAPIIAVRALTDALDHAARAFGEFIARAWAFLAPEPLAFTGEGWGGDFAAGGAPIDPALQQSMRHEARVPLYAAPRNC